MPLNVNLPRGFCLDEQTVLLSLLWKGEQWAIYSTVSGNRVLLAAEELAGRWIRSGLLAKSLFREFTREEDRFLYLESKASYILAPVEGGPSPNKGVDCLAFALSLKGTRTLDPESSLQDAVYVEQYARLLPTWTLGYPADDAVLLGTWLTGGVRIPATSIRRLSELLPWIPAPVLEEFVRDAGIPLPAEKTLPREDFLPSGSKAKTAFSLPGRPEIERFFNDHVVDIVFDEERYRRLGIFFPSAIVLHGPPGCGKTYAVERLVEFLDWPSFSIEPKSVASPYIHETSRKLSEVFEQAAAAAPSVLVIDEMESFLSDRGERGEHALHHLEETAEFLRRLPEASAARVLVVAMTNKLELIDPAILRKGRFDHVVEVGMPSREETEDLLRALLKDLPTAPGLDIEGAAELLKGRALSDASYLVREAGRLAAKAGGTEIDEKSFEEALKRFKENSEEKKRRIGF